MHICTRRDPDRFKSRMIEHGIIALVCLYTEFLVLLVAIGPLEFMVHFSTNCDDLRMRRPVNQRMDMAFALETSVDLPRRYGDYLYHTAEADDSDSNS